MAWKFTAMEHVYTVYPTLPPVKLQVELGMNA